MLIIWQPWNVSFSSQTPRFTQKGIFHHLVLVSLDQLRHFFFWNHDHFFHKVALSLVAQAAQIQVTFEQDVKKTLFAQLRRSHTHQLAMDVLIVVVESFILVMSGTILVPQSGIFHLGFLQKAHQVLKGSTHWHTSLRIYIPDNPRSSRLPRSIGPFHSTGRDTTWNGKTCYNDTTIVCGKRQRTNPIFEVIPVSIVPSLQLSKLAKTRRSL